MSLVVVEDAMDTLDTRVLLGGVLLLHGRLEPVENTSDEGRDQVGARLSTGDGLDEGEHQGEVAVDAMLGLKFARGLDTLPGGRNLDEDAVLGDADFLIELIWQTKISISIASTWGKGRAKKKNELTVPR